MTASLVSVIAQKRCEKTVYCHVAKAYCPILSQYTVFVKRQALLFYHSSVLEKSRPKDYHLTQIKKHSCVLPGYTCMSISTINNRNVTSLKWYIDICLTFLQAFRKVLISNKMFWSGRPRNLSVT